MDTSEMNVPPMIAVFTGTKYKNTCNQHAVQGRYEERREYNRNPSQLRWNSRQRQWKKSRAHQHQEKYKNKNIKNSHLAKELSSFSVILKRDRAELSVIDPIFMHPDGEIG